jgi:hypothetical protein
VCYLPLWGQRVSGANKPASNSTYFLILKMVAVLLIFVIDNISLFKTNSELYDINTRSKNNFYLPQPRLSIYKNGVYYVGIKAFNHLPPCIKKLSDNKNQFKNALKNYLLLYSFYSLKDFFNSNN